MDVPKGFSGRYRSAGLRARIVIGCFVLAVLAAAANVQHQLSGLTIIDLAERGQLTIARAEEFDRSGLILAILYGASLLLSLIALLAWLSRSVDNVPSLGGGTPIATPRWSIGWWFIPLANLVRPYRIIRDVHDRMATDDRRGGGWVILGWWLFWIVSNFIGSMLLQRDTPDTLDGLRTWFSVGAIIEALDIPAVVLAIVIVRRIQARADDRAADPVRYAPPDEEAVLDTAFARATIIEPRG